MNGIQLEEVISGKLDMSLDNAGILNNGVVTMSYGRLNPLTVNENEILFTLKVKASANGKLSDMITMSSLYTPAEAYVGEDLKVARIDLRFTNDANPLGDYALYQNEPNPFRNETRITFNMPVDDRAVIKFHDVAGRELLRKEMDAKVGLNELRVITNELGISGVIYYSIETGNFTATRKMIIID